jgi:prefoldin subunit 5
MSKDLPSYEDFAESNSNLPSIDDYITEENAEDLPSVEEFIVEEVVEEGIQTIEDANGNSFAEVKDIVPPWPELVKMVNDIRADIPDIPEIKYYDKELEELAEQISSLPEVRYYDREVEAICEQIDSIRESVKDFPEVNQHVDAIEDRLDNLQIDVTNLPEVKYYDSEIEAICEAIDEVKQSIPKFPKWINEVNEVPDFSWIGKTFSIIDDDFVKVNDTIDSLRGKVQFDIEQLSEDVETKYFNNSIKIESNVKDLDDKVNVRIDEEKDKIWKELRSSSLKMWEYHKEFKDDDRKLKKQILGEYNTLKQNINKELKEINYTSTKTDELLLKYFTELREEISELPEVKYYDKDIDYVKSDIKGLYKIVEEIKSSQKQLKEEQKLLAETNVPLGEDPPETDNSDPLTPLNQDFVTLDQLQKHYKIFVERVQYQLSSIGGGGAGFIKDLDDVDITGLADNYILQYDSSVSKWKTVANSGVGAGGTWASNSIGIHTTKNVGIATTARSDFALYVEGNQYVDGNITVGGTITYEDVKNVDSLGIVTARTGIDVLAGGINVIGISTISSGVGTIHVGVGSTALLVEGDARITGILTIGQGSITLDPTTKQVTGIDEIIVGSGASLSLAPLFTSQGKFSVDYSKLTLKGYISTLEGTYERQSTSFVLGTAPTTSGSARFQETSGYYYFLHESDNSKIIIFNIITGNWDAVHSSGSNFSSPSSGTLVNPVSNYSFVTPIRESYDGTGRAYPGSGFGIEYSTSVSDHTSSLGIATASSLEVSGIATVSTAFYMPQYTTSARDAATFAEGAMIYNTTTKKMEFYNGTSWQSLPGMSLGLTVALDG